MKKLILLAIAITTTLGAMAQKSRMVINFKDGTKVSYATADIDSVSFPTDEPQTKIYKVVPPTDFSGSSVYKIMANGVQVAEACYEYIRSWGTTSNVVDKQIVVLYPMGSNGKADLTQGIGADGSKIVWDLENDSIASYTAGSEAITELYVSSDGAWVESADGAVETTTEAYVIDDERATLDIQTYPIVKVGTQYWMGENLKAISFLDGTAITMYTSNQATKWNANTTGAYHVYTDDMDYCWGDFGAMYNGYAINSEKGLAPQGWEITTKAQWNAMKTYLRSSQSTKVKSESGWKKSGSNKSGLNIQPGGYYASTALGDSDSGEPVYYWTSDKTTDWLGTANLGVVIIQNTINTNSSHGYTFGHYVRCIRK